MDSFLLEPFMATGDAAYIYRKLFYFISTIAMKRIITSKGDGINYLGKDPNGEYHNMREFEGGFFEIVYEIWKGIIPKWEILTKDQFILEK